MQKIHETVKSTLSFENSDFALLFSEVMEYYKLKDVRAVFYGGHVLVIIPMPLRMKTLPIMNLCRIDIVYQPYNMPNRHKVDEGSYTKLSSASYYIAINNEQYNEFDDTHLDLCTKHQHF